MNPLSKLNKKEKKMFWELKKKFVEELMMWNEEIYFEESLEFISFNLALIAIYKFKGINLREK